MPKQLNVNLAFTSDTSQAKAQIQSLQQQLTSLINTPMGLGQKLTTDIQKATVAAADLKIHLEQATNVKTGTLDFSKLNQSLKQSGMTLSQYGIQLQKLGPQGQQAFMSLATAVAKAEVPLRRSNTLLKSFGTTLANTARWQLSSTMLHGFIGAISSAYNYSKDLNKSLNNIRIVTGKSIDEMAKFADQANKAAKALSASTTEYTNASLIYYQQGLKDSEVKERTEATIKMSNVTRQSAEVVSDQMTAIWNNFDNGSKSLEYYADVIAALGATTASSSDEIAQGLEKFAAVAETVGLSYEYATSALATVTATTRQSADVVGTAFKTLFARIQDLNLGETLDDGTTLGKYSEALFKVGINIKDSSGQLKEMDTILDEMGNKWDKLNKDQQVALAKSVAGIRQYTQLIALMDNWDYMKENLNTAKGSSGYLDEQQKRYEESWEAASKRVRASLETIYSSIFKDEFFIKLTNGFAGLIDTVGNFVKSIGGLQGVLSGLGWVLTKVFSEQMTQGFQNLAYNIRMSSEAGQKAVQQAKAAEMQRFANSMLNYETSTVSGQTMKKVYSEELIMQQQLIEKADQISEAERQRYQYLIDQHRVMGEQSIELSKQLELTKSKISNDYTQILGTGLLNGVGMNNAQGAIGYARESAEDIARIKIKLKEVGETSNITQQEINKLAGQLKNLGLNKAEIAEIASALKAASGDAGAMETAIFKVEAQLNKLQSIIVEIVAELMGFEKGSSQFKELSNKVAEYMNNIKLADEQTRNLKTSMENGAQSSERFAQLIKKAGTAAQSTASMISSCISGLMSLGMVISSVNGLIDAIKDPDASGWERFSRILMSVSMIAMSTMGVFSGLKAAYDLLSTGMLRNTVVTTLNSIAHRINEKEKKRKARTEAANNVITTISNKLNKKSAQVNTEEAAAINASSAAQERENRAKAKSVVLDNASNASGKSRTITKASSTKGTFTLKGVKPKLGANTMGTIGKALGRFGAAAAAIAIVAGTIALATAQYNKHTKAAKEAAEQAQQASEAYEAVSGAYSNFMSSVDAYKEAQKGLEEMTKGTDEYKDAVLEANEKTMELINQFKSLRYTVNEDGLIVLDEDSLKEAKELQQQYLKNAQISSLNAQSWAQQKQLEADSINFQRDKLKSNNVSDAAETGGNAAVAGGAGAAAGALGAVALGISSGPVGWIALAAGLIAAAIGGIVTASAGRANDEEEAAINKLANYYEKNGNARFASDSEFKSLLAELEITDPELIKSLVANREATAELAKEMAISNANRDAQGAANVKEQYTDQMYQYGLDEKQSDIVSSVIGSQMDTRIDKLYEDVYEDQIGGLTDENIQKQYAEAMGWDSDTIENQNGNKATYYKKDGTEVGVISDAVARRFLAEQQAYKDLEKVIKQVSQKFLELVNSTNEYDKALVEFLNQGDFSKINTTEYQALVNKVGGEDGTVSAEEAETYVNTTFGGTDGIVSDEEAMGYGYSTAEEFYEAFLLGFQNYETEKSKALEGITDKTQELLNTAGLDLSTLGAVDIKTVGSTVDRITKTQGEEAGSYLAHAFAAAGDEAGELAEVFSTINWDEMTPGALADTLDETGISTKYTVDQLSGLISIMSKDFTESIDTVKSKLINLKDMQKLAQGDTIKADQYNLLSDNAKSYFTLMLDGTYKLTKDAAEFYQLVKGEIKETTKNAIDDEITRGITAAVSTSTSEADLKKRNSDYGTGVVYSYDDYIANSVKAANLPATLNYKIDEGEGKSAGNRYMRVYELQGDVEGSDGDGFATTYALPGQMLLKHWEDGSGIEDDSLPEGQENFRTYYSDKDGNAVAYDLPLYGTENDYVSYRNEQWKNTTADKNSQTEAQKRIDYLKGTSWAADNVGQIEAWESVIAAGTLTAEMANTIYNTTQDYIGEYGNIKTTAEEASKNLISLTYEHFSQQEDTESRYQAYSELMSKEGLTKEQKKSINEGYSAVALEEIAEEKNEDIDFEAMDEYATHLSHIAEKSELVSDELKTNKKAAQDVALYIQKMNKGIDKLADGYKDWSDVLNNSTEASEEYETAMTAMKDAVSDVLGVSEEFLSDDFIKKHMDDIALAAQGDADAIDRLSAAAAKDILINVEFKDEQIKEDALKLHDELTNSIPDIKVGATLESGDFFTDAQSLIDGAAMTVEEAQAYFNSLGFEPEFVTEEKEIEQSSPITVTDTKVRGYNTGTVNVVQPDGTTKDVPWEYPILEQSTYQDGTTTHKGKMDVIAMSSNGKTPKIKSLTRKSSGAMNNYSSSNAGGKSPGSGGGGSSKSKKADKVKKSDVVERYKEVTDSLNDNSRAIDRASKAADRLYGKDRINKMKEINGLIEDEIALNEQKAAEAAEYMKQDRAELDKAAAKFGVKFQYDENGNITNYEEAMTAIWQAQADLIAKANADGNVTEEEQEELDKMDKNVSAVTDGVSTYDESNQTYKDSLDAAEDARDKLFENNMKILNTELEIKLELSDNDKKFIERQLEKLKEDVFGMSEAYAETTKLMDVSKDNIQYYHDMADDAKAMLDAEKIDKSRYWEIMQTVIDGITEETAAIEDQMEAMDAYYGDTLQMAQDEIATYTSLMEHSTAVLDHYTNILDLTGQSMDFEKKGTILAGQVEATENAYGVATQTYQMLAAEAERAEQRMNEAINDPEKYEQFREDWEKAQAAANEAQDQMLSSAEAHAEAIVAAYENELAKLGKIFEDALTDGIGFDHLNTQLERAQSLQEEFLTTTNKIYETTKLMRNAQNEIDKTTNTVAKQKLKAFQQETQQLQNQNQLSQFELDMQQKKYDLLLAEIALEEAQNAKSVVTLQRDSEGNFGYIYTADQEQVSGAEQAVDDAENALYNHQLEGVNNYAQKRVEIEQAMYDEIKALEEAYMAGEITWDEWYNRTLELKEYYSQKLGDVDYLYFTALGDSVTISQEAWSFGLVNMDTTAEQIMNKVDEYLFGENGAYEKFKSFKTEMDTIAFSFGLGDNNTIAKSVEEILTKDEALADHTTNTLIPALQDEIIEVGNLAKAWADAKKELDAFVGAENQYAQNKANEKKEASGYSDDDNTSNSSSETTDTSSSNSENTAQTSPPPSPPKQEERRYTVKSGDTLSGIAYKYYGDSGYNSCMKIFNANTDILDDPDLIFPGQNLLIPYDTGGYTGEWGPEGKLAMLHQKELVLNAHQTEDLLMTMELLDSIIKQIDMMTMNSKISQMHTAMNQAINAMYREQMAQEVHIEANFPNATDRNEIYQALEMLANDASQFINR